MASTSPISAIEAKIDAVTFSEGVEALSALAASLSASAPASGGISLVAIEDIVAAIDPALIPAIGGIRKILPLLSGALAMLEPAPGFVPGNDIPGAPSTSRGR